MATEIERKFLLASDTWRNEATEGERLAQGYLSSDASSSVRVRVKGDKAWLNIKGVTTGIARPEYEYEIPLSDGQEILEKLVRTPIIDKTRYLVVRGDHTWEIDEFYGDNRGLLVAEVELGSADEAFERPEWLGPEVSDDPRYLNAALVTHPYTDWVDEG